MKKGKFQSKYIVSLTQFKKNISIENLLLILYGEGKKKI